MPLHPQAEQIAEHIAYEFDRLTEDAQDLQALVGPVATSGHALPGGDVDQRAINRILESLMTHARNLYDIFFIEPMKKRPDVAVEHFFDAEAAWVPDAAVLCPYLHGQRERLNRSFKHLSYDRIMYESAKGWNIHSVVTELTGVWNDFLARLPADRRAWFRHPGTAVPQPYYPPPNLCAKTQPTANTDVRTF